MRIIHISDPHFTGGDNDTSADWRDYEFSNLKLNDPMTWVKIFNELGNALTWKADSLNRSTTLTNFLISNKSTRLKSDTIVITGDLTDSGEEADYNRGKGFIQALTSGGYNVYTVPGNHDYAFWGWLAWASEECRTRFHQLPGTSGNKNAYPYVITIGNDRLILLDSMKAQLDEQNYGGRCTRVPLMGSDYDCPLSPNSINHCMYNSPVPLPIPPIGTVSVKSGQKTAEGKLGEEQRNALNNLLNSYKADRLKGSKVIVCLHHQPFDQSGNSGLDDGAEFLSIVRGKVDALLFGHSTPPYIFWQDGGDVNGTSPTDWEKDNGIPLVSCVNLQHAGPLGETPEQPSYPIIVIDTDKNWIEVHYTDTEGSEPRIRPGFSPGVITGKVCDSQTGMPISGATIHVCVNPALVPIASAATDPNGIYSVAVFVSDITYDISVTTKYYPKSSAQITVPRGATITQNFSLTSTAPVLKGKVTDQQRGTPIIGAKIEVSDFYASYGDRVETTATDSNGMYSVHINYPTVWSVKVNVIHKDYEAGYDQFTIGAGGTTKDFSLYSIAPGTITGKVTDEQGTPIAGAKVFASGGIVFSSVETTADTNGAYSLNISAGDVAISANATGYVGNPICGVITPAIKQMNHAA